ncbi:MAG: tail fiber domain-containing protein [Armatimonadia bacterium]
MGSSTTTSNSNSSSSSWGSGTSQPSGWVPTEMENVYNDQKQNLSSWNPNFNKPVVGFNPTQLAAFQQVQNLQGAGAGQISQANQVSDRLSNFQSNDLNATTFQLPEGYLTKYSDWIEEGLSKYDLPSLDSLIGAMGSVPQAPTLSGVSGGAGTNVTADQITAAQIARGDVRDVSGGDTLANFQKMLGGIDDTYFQEALDPTLKELQRQKDIEQQRNGSAAAAAGAFGGSRHGVTEAETNRAWLDEVAATTGDMNLKKLAMAQGLSEADLARQLQAGVANQGADFNVASTNANLNQRTGEANASNNLTASTTNANIAAQMASQNASLQAQAQMAAYNAQVQAMQSRAGLASDWMQTRLGYGTQLSDTRAGLATGEAGLINTAGMNAAGQINDMAQFNENSRATAAGINLQGANLGLLTGDKENEWGRTQTGLLAESGAAQQAQAQAEADALYQNEWMNGVLPQIKTGIQMDMLGQIPYGTTTTENGGGTSASTSTSKTSTPWWQTLANVGMQVGAAALSDKRLKKNITPIKSALDKVRKLQGVDYDWKTGQPASGLLAQDVQKALPRAISSKGGALHYDMPAVLGLLTEAVKDLDRKVSAPKPRRK